MNDTHAAAAFSALGHPNRVAILRLLVRAGDKGLNVSQMREHLDIPATTFGHHLKAMADAGLVKQSRHGRSLISKANYNVLQSLGTFLMEDCCRGVFSPSQTVELEPS
ncbi:MAG: metalloregulator ArsR/SmtB family transcription factor [Hyphomonadaceae bacterium]|nr:metalloregulator ArsR/SmtB family transcription factor [Hyphomonadaceae bacterium]